eukprot:TRINITY_DN11307_c0_g1_i1.p1 TRINITY_DN11307_c0_g1~~TRINITY_DN11307_c0_g1_i1.p1  ORF type:complete len:753 (-),score=121.77 TRINITY_DN11307_c0_g1_i1:188-2446(-)
MQMTKAEVKAEEILISITQDEALENQENETVSQADLSLEEQGKPLRRLSAAAFTTTAFFKDSSSGTGVRYRLFLPTSSERPFTITAQVHDNLYDYQREGVCWLWHRYCNNSGGLLGDDMGLGKTIQVIAFLRGMFHAQRVSSVLIVVPVSLLANWQREFAKWAPRIPVMEFHEVPQARRREILRDARANGGVLLTTYGTLSASVDSFETSGITWDYVVLDEAHKIKNPATKGAKALRRIESSRRILLTGTPIQNNLSELWSLFDYLCDGKLLGPFVDFKRCLADKIVRGHRRDVNGYEKEVGDEAAKQLQKLIMPYYLRRDKASALGCRDTLVASTVADMDPPCGRYRELAVLQPKTDLVVWLRIAPAQLEIYRRYLRTEQCKSLRAPDARSPLVALTQLKKVCDHPWLLLDNKMFACALNEVREKGWESANLKDVVLFPDEPQERRPACNMVEDCVKMNFTLGLLRTLRTEGHRVLVFSASVKMLNIIHMALSHESDMAFVRIDGRLKPCLRQAVVDEFNSNPEIFCCLLTTAVGGVGLTLTGADRVIVVDPSWNPATDTQAIDRAYRIGQAKPVVVYRLITCGTLEEKIYRVQIFKQGVARTVEGTQNIPRHFTTIELSEMFDLGELDESSTAKHLGGLAALPVIPECLQKHLAALRKVPGFIDFSDHGAVFGTPHESCLTRARDGTEAEGGPKRCRLDAGPSCETPVLLRDGTEDDGASTNPIDCNEVDALLTQEEVADFFGFEDSARL